MVATVELFCPDNTVTLSVDGVATNTSSVAGSYTTATDHAPRSTFVVRALVESDMIARSLLADPVTNTSPCAPSYAKPAGPILPTWTVATTVSLVSLITLTVFDPLFATNTSPRPLSYATP